MTVNDKIKFFYDGIKVKSNHKPFKSNPHLEITIPLIAAVTLAVSAAVVLPIVLTGEKTLKEA